MGKSLISATITEKGMLGYEKLRKESKGKRFSLSAWISMKLVQEIKEDSTVESLRFKNDQRKIDLKKLVQQINYEEAKIDSLIKEKLSKEEHKEPTEVLNNVEIGNHNNN